MDELAVQQRNLPVKMEDLGKFILVGREKLISVRAEIRAIDKLQLAEEVRNQKREEAQMLSEALLDAEVKLGELLKQIPKDLGGRPPKPKTMDTAVHSFQNAENELMDSGVHGFQNPENKTMDSGVHSFEKPKKEVLHDLGFSEKQAQRFETLADNKDLVERVKAEARERDDLATRSRVLDLAKLRREQEQSYYQVIDLGADCFKKLNKAVNLISELDVSDDALNALFETYNEVVTLSGHLKIIREAMQTLQRIQIFLERRASIEKR